jgi:predicted metal-binding protein
MLSEYKSGLLIQFANITPAHESRKSLAVKNAVAILEREMFLDGFYKAFGMGSGPCRFCRICDLRKPCRYPERARPAMEACGIDVFQTARNNGLTIDVVREERSSCTYFGLILIE